MGAWGIKALERDEGLDVLDILKNEYVPEHPVMDLGEMIELMKEEVMLGSDFSQIDFLFDNTAMALAELYFQWKDNSKLDYDHEEAIWDKVTGFTASKEALAFLLRQLTDIKNEVPDEDGIREIVDLWKNEDSGEIAPAWLEHLNQLIDRLDSEQEARQMYIKKYWGNFIGGSDDSLNLVAFLEDQKKEEIPLSEIFAKIGLDKQNWDFRQTVEYLEFTHSDGVEMDFHFAIDVVTDLAAILLECSVSGSVNLQDLDEYNTPIRRIRITATPEEHEAMDKALADFAQSPLTYDLHEMMDDEEIQEMAHHVEALRKELYEAAGRNRNYQVKAEDVKHLLADWEGADGCIATNRITVEGRKVGYCYREIPDGNWDSGWRFTAGDESDEYMDDPNNAGIYKLNTICNDDPDIISLLNTPAPCAFERDENGVFQQIKDWKPDEDEEDPDMDILKQCQKWHEESKQHKIIDALEAIPAEERTPEMDSELARAYNNLADPHKPTCKEMVMKCDKFKGKGFDAFLMSQMWDCQENRERIFRECKYQVVATDMLAAALPALERANLDADFLEALAELYPTCEAFYFQSCGKLFLAEDVRSHQIEGSDRFIRFGVNVRFFNIEGTEDMPIEGFDVASYTNKMVDMFTSESSKEVTLLCENELMRIIIDHYGEDAPVERYDDAHFTAKIEVNPSGTFYGWIFKFKGKIKILSPKECITEMQQIARQFI